MVEQKNGLGLKGTTNLSLASSELAKKELLKISAVNNEAVEKVVQNIHSTGSKLTRLSLDVTAEMYDSIKRKQLDKKFKTTRDYLTDLVEKDINNH
jgi:rRNA maturation endonuclease Nob1